MSAETYGVINGYICSNVKRVATLHLLKNSQDNSMQVEKIATSLGISHRTAIYHLDILKEYNLVEVRDYKTKGPVPARSVWGLNCDNEEHLSILFEKINGIFSETDLDQLVTRNKKPR
ncbi:MAG: hypothetical protein U9P44_03190 [archaeon]|nr:hypothetical protein [archaeon]